MTLTVPILHPLHAISLLNVLNYTPLPAPQSVDGVRLSSSNTASAAEMLNARSIALCLHDKHQRTLYDKAGSHSKRCAGQTDNMFAVSGLTHTKMHRSWRISLQETRFCAGKLIIIHPVLSYGSEFWVDCFLCLIMIRYLTYGVCFGNCSTYVGVCLCYGIIRLIQLIFWTGLKKHYYLNCIIALQKSHSSYKTKKFSRFSGVNLRVCQKLIFEDDLPFFGRSHRKKGIRVPFRFLGPSARHVTILICF